jgi:hypothetical protein
MMESEKKPRTHTEPLPRSLEELVQLFKLGISLPDVEEIRVTASEFHIRRVVEDGQVVLPKESGLDEALDPDFVLGRIELEELPFVPEAHPYRNIEAAMRQVMVRGLRPGFLFAPEGPWLSAYLDLPETPPIAHVFGMRVVYSHLETYQEKFVVVGGPTQYLTDASFGAIIDMGI